MSLLKIRSTGVDIYRMGVWYIILIYNSETLYSTTNIETYLESAPQNKKKAKKAFATGIKVNFVALCYLCNCQNSALNKLEISKHIIHAKSIQFFICHTYIHDTLLEAKNTHDFPLYAIYRWLCLKYGEYLETIARQLLAYRRGYTCYKTQVTYFSKIL